MTPLSYLAQQPVLQYLEPNLRILLSHRCPLIPEKLVPIFIENLQIEHNSIIINKTMYDFTIHKDITPIGRPDHYDLDEFGAVDLDSVVEPHNDEILIDTRNVFSEQVRISGEMRDITLESRRIAKIQDDDQRALQQKNLDQRVLMHGVNALRLIARECQTELTGFPVPAVYSMKFGINKLEPRRHVIHGELLTYKRKIHDAMKHLIVKLFCGRSSFKVKNLKIDSRGILRIPKSLNLKVQHLLIPSEELDKILEAIRPNLSSLESLESLTIEKTYEFQNPMVQAIPLIILKYGYGYHTLLRINTGYPRIHVTHSINRISETIRIWLEEGREIGTCWTFESERKAEGKVFMADLKKDTRGTTLEGPPGSFPTIIFRMSDSTELRVTYEFSKIINTVWNIALTIHASSQ